MNSKAYWTLVLYGAFCRIMFGDYGDGFMDAFATILWLGVTLYLAYNMQWHAYSEYRVGEVEPYQEKGKDGKIRIGYRATLEHNDAVQDVGFWLFWLAFLFVLDLFDLTIAAVLFIGAFLFVKHAANNARPWYDKARAWFIYIRARVRYAVEQAMQYLRSW